MQSTGNSIEYFKLENWKILAAADSQVFTVLYPQLILLPTIIIEQRSIKTDTGNIIYNRSSEPNFLVSIYFKYLDHKAIWQPFKSHCISLFRMRVSALLEQIQLWNSTYTHLFFFFKLIFMECRQITWKQTNLK